MEVTPELWSELAIVAMGALLLAFAVGVSGFADALIGAAIWVHILEPVSVTMLIFACGLFVHTLSLRSLVADASVGRRSHLRLTIPGLFGVPLGIGLLQIVGPEFFKNALGGFLIVVSLILLATSMRRTGEATRATDSSAALARFRSLDRVCGFCAGVLGGLCGMSGVLPALLSTSVRLEPSQHRMLIQPFIVAMHGAGLMVLLAVSGVSASDVWRFLVCVPLLLLGLRLGFAVYDKIDAVQFRRTILLALITSGAYAIVAS